MEKIKQLLVKAGCKEDLVESICESLEQYKTTLKQQFDNEYAAKVEEAKRVCVEETEGHKRELARRLQIFCETKGAAIEAQLARQSALNESEALTKLYAVRNVLEGLPNGEQNGNVKAALGKATQQVKLANEERDRAVAVANRQTAIAEKVLKNNRALTTQIAKMKGQPVTESRQPAATDKRIDGQRQQRRQAVTTRPTLVENQDRTPARAAQTTPTRQTGRDLGYGIQDIAANMEEIL